MADQPGADPATDQPDVGVNGSVNSEAQAVDGGTAAPAPVAGARRRLSPRPVPVNRRRRTPAATDEERTPAEEMDDVGTQDDKAKAAEGAKAGATPDKSSTDAAAESNGSGTTTATRTARPKTAAEIVAEQRAREKAAAENPAGAETAGAQAAGSETVAPAAANAATAASKDAAGKDPAETTATKPVGKVAVATRSGASGNKPSAGRSGSGVGRGKQALGSVGSGVRKLRNLIASLIWLAAVLAAAVLALGALFTALDQTNQSNEIVRWVLERGHDLVGPFKDLFRLETAKNTLLVNWGIAALVYLIAGKIIERFVRP